MAKRFLLFIALFLVAAQMSANKDQKAITLGHKGGPRSGMPLYSDMPQAFHDIKAHEIIIDGGGAVSYYDVEISSATTGAVEMTTTVSGTYDTFNISSLTPGTHVITIESPSGNTFEGTFTTY